MAQGRVRRDWAADVRDASRNVSRDVSALRLKIISRLPLPGVYNSVSAQIFCAQFQA